MTLTFFQIRKVSFWNIFPVLRQRFWNIFKHRSGSFGTFFHKEQGIGFDGNRFKRIGQKAVYVAGTEPTAYGRGFVSVVRSGFAMVMRVPGSVECVSHTLPPITEPFPITTAPRMVAPA